MHNFEVDSTYDDVVLNRDIPEDAYKDRYQKFDLHPDSEFHRKIISKILYRARESYNEISSRYPQWRKIDESLNVYIRMDDDEQETKEDDDRKPVSLVIPLEYGVMETVLTFMAGIFFEEPIFRYRESEPNDIVKAALLEQLISKQVRRAKMPLNLHTGFRDSFAYGFGLIAPEFTKKYAFRTRQKPIMETTNLDNTSEIIGYEDFREKVVSYEGNVLHNIDPYLCLPDPNVAIHDIQKGSFFGWVEPTDYESLLEDESNDDTIFNVRFMKTIDDGRSNIIGNDSGRYAKFGKGTSRKTTVNRPVDIIHMVVRLIPSEWDLGDSDYPEKWYFKIAADRIVIKMAKLNLDHDMYPVASCAPRYDGYKTTPLSDAELLYPMQEAVNWFINSHVANTRKAINDIIIVDPTMINLPDLQTSEPGKIVRLKQAAWGRDIRSAIMQLNITDVTQGHVSDAMMLINLANNLLGVDTASTVRRRTSERVSSAEAKNDIMVSNSKLAKTAKIIAYQMMYDLSYMMASHTIQLMEQTQYVNTIGRYKDVLDQEYPSQRSIGIQKPDIDLDYDIDIQDGVNPGTEDVQAMNGFMQVIMTQPQIAAGFDIPRLFQAVARASGFRNVHEFVRQGGNINSQVMNQEQIQQGVQAGNFVPLGGV